MAFRKCSALVLLASSLWGQQNFSNPIYVLPNSNHTFGVGGGIRLWNYNKSYYTGIQASSGVGSNLMFTLPFYLNPAADSFIMSNSAGIMYATEQPTVNSNASSGVTLGPTTWLPLSALGPSIGDSTHPFSFAHFNGYDATTFFSIGGTNVVDSSRNGYFATVSGSSAVFSGSVGGNLFSIFNSNVGNYGISDTTAAGSKFLAIKILGTAGLQIGDSGITSTLKLVTNSHMSSAGALPAISGANCSLATGSTDVKGAIATTGTNPCVVTFVNSYTTAPFCLASSDVTGVATIPAIYSVTTTSFTMNATATQNVKYICIQ